MVGCGGLRRHKHYGYIAVLIAVSVRRHQSLDARKSGLSACICNIGGDKDNCVERNSQSRVYRAGVDPEIAGIVKQLLRSSSISRSA